MWQHLVVCLIVIAAALYALRVLRRWLSGMWQAGQPGAGSAPPSGCGACRRCGGCIDSKPSADARE